MVHITVFLMVKNEQKRLHVSLDSIRKFADSLCIFDTGSTDDTMNIIRNFCEETKIPLRLMEGGFTDFSTSRNVGLDFVETFSDVDYILQMDCNDELVGGDKLRKFSEDFTKEDKQVFTGFMVTQQWRSNQVLGIIDKNDYEMKLKLLHETEKLLQTESGKASTALLEHKKLQEAEVKKCILTTTKEDKYFNMRFIRARTGWRYRGVVHEYMKNCNYEEMEWSTIYRISDPDIYLYQDRTQDDDKSSKRFPRDKKLLLDEYKKDPTEPRTVFYLAQTCSCTNEYEDSYYYYKIRSGLEGFQEEKFHSFLRMGDIGSKHLNLNWHTSLSNYMKAFEHSKRAEPLVKIAEFYRLANDFITGFMFIDMACNLLYPEKCILFVDKYIYDYERWHLMGILSWYACTFCEIETPYKTYIFTRGKYACMKALESNPKQKIDQDNLNFYLDTERNNNQSSKGTGKLEFIKQQIDELRLRFPTAIDKELQHKAEMLWRRKNKKEK